MTLSPLQQLDALHTTYVEAVNEAVAADHPADVRRLAAAYDVETARILNAALGLDDLAARRVSKTSTVSGLRRRVTRRRHAA